MIVVQRMRTHWTKASRGGVAAARRNAVPEAVALPAAGRPGLLVHSVEVREASDFVPSDEVSTLDWLPESDWRTRALAADRQRRRAGRSDAVPEPAWQRLETRGGVSLREEGGRLVVTGRPAGGQPQRYGHPRQVFVLELGAWARWRINFRFGPECACGSEWRYEKWVVNVAYLAGPVSPELFAAGQPSRIVDELAPLF